jgi:hypothetical protein
MFVPKSDWLVSQYNRPRLFLNLVGLYSQNETEYRNGKSPDDDASYSNTIRAAMMASPDDDLDERRQCRKLTASFVGAALSSGRSSRRSVTALWLVPTIRPANSAIIIARQGIWSVSGVSSPETLY